MVERKRIGIVFSNNENWIGGTYYILNLISALNTLEDLKKPHITVFLDNPKDADIIITTQYPYFTFVPLAFQYNIFERVVNKVGRLVFKKNIFVKKHKKEIVEVVFPYDFQISLINIPQKICWIPDFQEYFLKDFFSENVLAYRKKQHLQIIEQNLPLVFSSKESQKDFKQIYPQARNQTFILNFAVTHPKYDDLNISELKQKFNITKPYFISPNQFWIHKNHKILIEAVIALKKEQPINFQLIFTGKEYDFRYPDYANQLKKIVKDNDLEEIIKFLGFIDRKEQLQLMNHAIAVMQSSLFEGWSTVVEDAKAMNQILLLSALAVHKEQTVHEKSLFFNPQSVVDLQNCITKFLEEPFIRNQQIPYKTYVSGFAKRFIEIIQTI